MLSTTTRTTGPLRRRRRMTQATSPTTTPAGPHSGLLALPATRDVAVRSKKRPFSWSETGADLCALGGTRTPNLLIRSYAHIPAKTMYTQVGPYVPVRRRTRRTQSVAVCGCGTRAIREGRYAADFQGKTIAVTHSACDARRRPPRTSGGPLADNPAARQPQSVTAVVPQARKQGVVTEN
jgi:hypothetical protein